MIYKCFLDEFKRIKKFYSSSNFDLDHRPRHQQKSSNWLILTFAFIHCKAEKVSQDDQIQMWRWFTSVFLMNGRELRRFSHFQIMSWIAYSDLSRNLENWLILKFVFIHSVYNWLILKFVFIHCKTLKICQDDQIRM